jgi:hypothetical protein
MRLELLARQRWLRNDEGEIKVGAMILAMDEDVDEVQTREKDGGWVV